MLSRRLMRDSEKGYLCHKWQGVPMITMGDEYGHTKGGNNNTYCHDNPVSFLLAHICCDLDSILLAGPVRPGKTVARRS